MIKKIKYIATLLLLLSFIPATSGIMIYHHVCSDTGEHSIGVFNQPSCTHKHNKSCCSSSCEIEHPMHHGEHSYNHSHCNDFEEYKSIENTFLTLEKKELKANIQITEYIKAGLENKESTFENKISRYCDNDIGITPIQEYITFIQSLTTNIDEDHIA